MRKICFGKNITSVNNKMSNLTKNINSSLREVYRFPKDLVDISNCFNGCVNFTKFEAELPNTIKNMSSSFEGCGNFYKNVAIPSNCVDMSKSFKGTRIKGRIEIPNKVSNMRESFKDSNLTTVYFKDKNNNIEYNLQECFMNCTNLYSIDGKLPNNIKNANNAFKNTGFTTVDFLTDDCFIEDAQGMFESCINLKSVSSNIFANNCDKIFNSCKNLRQTGNIKGNSFSHTWNGCSNLKSIGVISGVLNFNNTFYGCSNYSDIVYLNPYCDNSNGSYLSMNHDNDKNFLDAHPLRIYGTGHGWHCESNFQSRHREKGDYISGYCDIEDFEIIGNQFSNYNGTSKDLYIPKYFRTNLLDESTKYVPVFKYAFKYKTFDTVSIVGGDISENAFKGASINALYINFLETKDHVIINKDSFCDSKIKNLEIYGQRIISIGERAFKNATINSSTFLNCYNIGNSSFENASGYLFFYNSINHIYNNAFNNFKGAISGERISVNTIDDDAFKNISSTINGFKCINIGNNVFYNSKNINNLDLTNVVRIGENAFYNTNLEKIEIKDTNNILVKNSLAGMNNLKTLTVDYLNVNHFGGAFPNSLIDVTMTKVNQDINSTQKLKSVQNITMLNGGDIQSNQFRGLTNLKIFTSYNNPNVGTYAFAGCNNLSSISRVGDVSGGAFLNCSNLKKLYANRIVNYALNGCINITDLEATLENWTISKPYHIGLLWSNNYFVVNENSNSTYPEIGDTEILFNYQINSTYHDCYAINMSKKLTNVKINLSANNASVSDTEVNGFFKDLDNLKRVDFSYWWDSNCFYNTFVNCPSLIDCNITDKRGWYLPDDGLIKGAYNLVNLSLNFSNTSYNYSQSSRIKKLIANLPEKIENFNITCLSLNNPSPPIFTGLNIGNYSNNLTIIPQIYTNGYLPDFNSCSIRTNNIAIYANSTGTVWAPSNININNKTMYFNKISLYRDFFINRTNVNVYVEDVNIIHNVANAKHFYFNGSSNINIYYSNSNMKPNIYTNTTASNVSNQLILEANDGNNYYYSKNINIIYEPNYNFSNYVSNIK